MCTSATNIALLCVIIMFSLKEKLNLGIVNGLIAECFPVSTEYIVSEKFYYVPSDFFGSVLFGFLL